MHANSKEVSFKLTVFSVFPVSFYKGEKRMRIRVQNPGKLQESVTCCDGSIGNALSSEYSTECHSCWENT